MLRRRFETRVYAFLLATLCGTPVAAEVVFWKNVGDWDVSFYPNSGGCLAAADYEGGMTFFIGVTSTNDKLMLEFSLISEEWKSLEADKQYTVLAKFGNETPWTLEMTGIELQSFWGLNFVMDAVSDQAGVFIDEFMRETTMEWTFDGKELAYVTLRGSRAAFNEAVECTKSYRSAVEQSSDPFTSSGEQSSNDPFAN